MTANDSKFEVSRKRAYFMWFLAALFYFYQFFLQVSPSSLKSELSMAFNASAQDYGVLSSYYITIYAIMQIPAGLLMDKYGARRLLTIATAICATGSFIFATADTLYAAKIARFVMGLGGSFAVVSCLKITSMWFARTQFAFLTGLMVMIGMLGAAHAQAPFAALLQYMSWQDIFYWTSLVGIALAAIIAIFVKDKEEELAHSDSKTPAPLISGLIEILTNKQIWLVALYAGLMFTPTLAFGELWSIPFLMEAYSMDKTTAGALSSLVFFGWAFGGPIYGFVSDKLGNRNIPMYFANVSTMLVLISIMYIVDLPNFMIGALFLLLGAFSSGFIIAFAVVRESSPNYLAGTAVGFTNFINTIGGAVAQPFIGWVLDSQWEGGLTDTMEKIFSLSEYQSALFVLPVLLSISFLCLMLVKETHAKSLYEHNEAK